MAATLVLASGHAHAHAHAQVHARGPTSLIGSLHASTEVDVGDPTPAAWRPLPLGSVAPQGWLLNQLLTQANSLSGYMPTSTFPGAIDVNTSLWFGGNLSSGTDQWLPYWANGNVPLLMLIRAANATSRLDPGARLEQVIESTVHYVLSHANRSSGWLGPYLNEPGDANGHGLWDPLNMLRALLMYAEGDQEGGRSMARRVAAAVVAHLAAEYRLLRTDPVYKWASTRWPTFVAVCLYVIDHLVPSFGDDPAVMPLGPVGTTALLLNASRLFERKGMDWHAYYSRTGAVKFPLGPVAGWNTNDHGVNNAEGALAWPAMAYRLHGNRTQGLRSMGLVLEMIDTYQAQPNALLCADEVFCGRAPHRGTETCAVVEAMASLEQGFAALNEPSLFDRVERLAFNALPAALTADMWTHVYVQQANSVFAGSAAPTDGNVGDTPSGEDRASNYYGVSHFPCCITNFPQGWPKFAASAVMAAADGSPAFVLASLVPVRAALPFGGSVQVEGAYPFGDAVHVRVVLPAPLRATAFVRIPGWADQASIDGKPAPNGTLVAVPCVGSSTLLVELQPRVRTQAGWGVLRDPADPGRPPTNALTVSRGPLLFALHPAERWRVVKSYDDALPGRPLAVDYEISTSEPWAYALARGAGEEPFGLEFDASPSAGWSLALPFSTEDYPFSVRASAVRLGSWGYWNGSNITAQPPPSPVDCTRPQVKCAAATERLRLVPFGGTNIRISVFPWTAA